MINKMFHYAEAALTLGFTALVAVSPASADTLVATGSEIKLVSPTGSVQTFVASAGKAVVYNPTNQKIYYSTTSGTIRRVDRDGTNSVEIIPPVGDNISDIVIDQTHSRLIWTEPMNASIRSADLDGSNASMLVFGASEPTGLFIDQTNSYLYFTAFDGVSRVDLDGSNLTPLFADNYEVLTYLTIYNGKVYWSNATSNAVKRADLDGSNLETIVSGSSAPIPQGLRYNSKTGRIEYVGDPSGAGGLRTMRTSGNSNTTLANISGYGMVSNFFVTDPSAPTIPALTRMYFGIYDTQSAQSRVFWTNFSKQIVPVLSSSDVGSVGGLAFSPTQQMLYWSDNTGSSQSVIKRSNADGSGIETFANISGQVNGLSVDDSRGLLYISNKTGAEIQSLSLENPGVRESILTLDPNDVLIDGSVTSYSTDRLTYAYQVHGSTNGRAGYVAKGAGHANTTLMTSLTAFWGYAAYDLSLGFGVRTWVAQLPYKQGLGFVMLGVIGPELRSDLQKAVVGSQHLDPSKYETPYALYYGYNHKIRVVIPHVASPLNMDFLSLGGNEVLKALTEVPLAPEFPSPTPTPAAGTVTGKVNVGGEAEAGTSQIANVSASASAANITVYLNPDLQSPSSFSVDDKPLTQTTRTDADGVYTFTNVPDGNYSLSFSRNDLTFATASLSVSPGTEVPTLIASQRDVASSNCTTTDRSALVLGADTKAKKIVTLALAAAKKAFAKSKAQAALQSSSRVLSNLHKSLNQVSASLPKVEISCSAPTSCTSTSYKATTKNYKKALAKVKKQALKLLGLALKGKSTLAGQVKKLGGLSDAADKATLKLPTKSFSCPEPTVPDSDGEVTTN